MVDLLNENFVNAWILIHDLPELLEHDDPAVRVAAEICQVEHIYPVDSLVLTHELDYVDGLWIQDIMGLGQRPEFLQRPPSKYLGQWNAGYLAFLKETLAKAN